MENPEPGQEEKSSPAENIQEEHQILSLSGQVATIDISEDVQEEMKKMSLRGKPDENLPSEKSDDITIVFESNKEQKNIVRSEASEIQITPKIGATTIDDPTESASGLSKNDTLPYVEQISQACEQLTDICTRIGDVAPSLEKFINLVPKSLPDQQETCSRLASISLKLSALALQLSSSSWKLTVLLKILTVTPAKIQNSTDKLVEVIEKMQKCTDILSKGMQDIHSQHFGLSENPVSEDVMNEIKKGYELADICSKELDVTVAQFQSAKGMELEFNEICEVDQSEFDAFMEACKNPTTDW